MRTVINVNIIIYQVTKCTFHKYGPSGTVTRHDGLCILALNIINEKVQHHQQQYHLHHQCCVDHKQDSLLMVFQHANPRY